MQTWWIFNPNPNSRFLIQTHWVEPNMAGMILSISSISLAIFQTHIAWTAPGRLVYIKTVKWVIFMFYWSIIVSICRGNTLYNNHYQLASLSLLFQLIHCGNISMIYCILVEKQFILIFGFCLFFLFIFYFPLQAEMIFYILISLRIGFRWGGGHFSTVFFFSF